MARVSSQPFSARLLAGLALATALPLLPLPWHRVVLLREYAGVFYEGTSLVFYLADLPLVVLAILGAWTTFKRPVPMPPLARLLALFAALVWVSLLWAFDPTVTAVLALRLTLLLAVAIALYRLRPDPRAAYLGVALLLATQAAMALAQFYRQDDLGLRRLGELDLNRFPGGGSLVIFGDQYWLRAYGLTPHPNILGGFLVVALLLGAAAFLSSGRRGRLLWGLLLPAGCAALLVTYSRAAWLGAVAGGAVLTTALLLKPAWRRRLGRPLLLVALPALLLLIALGWQQRALLGARLDPSSSAAERRSVDERTVLNAAALELLSKAPLTGVGGGNFAPAVAPLVADRPATTPQPAHNVPLLAAAELGPAGILLWLGLSLYPLLEALRAWRRGRLELWAAALASAMLAFAVVEQFDYYTYGWQHGRALRWLLWGLWLATMHVPVERATEYASR